MVQTALDLLKSVFWEWQTLWRWLLWLGLLGGVGLLWLRLFRRPGYDRLLPRLREVLGPLAGWGGALLLFALSLSVMGTLGQLVLHRVSAGDNASGSRNADPDAAPTTQAAPTVSYLTETTYRRSLTLPPALLKQVRAEGVQVLAPYLTDPSSQNILRLRDRFSRSGRDVVFTREATLRSEEPLRLDRSHMNVGLDFVSPMQGARRSYYNATFSGQYSFSNPLKTPITARFVFPLPSGSGTLSDFRVVVNGQELSAAELMNGSGWQGTLAPGQSADVQVTYRHQGARGWNYLLSTRREPIRDFALNVKTNAAPKFQRYSLYPTRTARTLTGTNLSWELKNVITAQNIALTFTTASLRETLNKMYVFAPLALLLAGLFGLVWTRWNGLRVTPLSVGLATLSVLAGLMLGGVLMSYLPVYLAGPLGAVVASVLALRSLGRAYWPPVLLATLLPLAFLVVGHAGLILALVALVLLAVLTWIRPGPLPQPSGPAAPQVERLQVARRENV